MIKICFRYFNSLLKEALFNIKNKNKSKNEQQHSLILKIT